MSNSLIAIFTTQYYIRKFVFNSVTWTYVNLQCTRHFELLNYSEHGTTVDNVLYSCDFSEKRVTSSPPASGLVASVRKVLKKSKRRVVSIQYH